MKRLCFAVVALATLLVGGCNSTKGRYDPPKALDTMTPQEVCDYYKFYLSNPDLLPETRKIATDKMRAKNCPAG